MSFAENSLFLHILGTGRGASQVYAGHCSTAMVLAAGDDPLLMIDVGLGATRACLNIFPRLPEAVAITHNHTDHAGELPVILRVEAAAGRRLRVFAETEVGRRLQRYRLAEHAERHTPDELADWRVIPAGHRAPLVDDLELEFVPAVHSEHCCGLIVYKSGNAVLGYSGDSIADESLYAKLARSRTRLIDARPGPTRWHASFDEVRNHMTGRTWLTGHGLDKQEAPDDLQLVFAGDRLSLD